MKPNTSLDLQKRRICKFPLLLAQALQSVNIWDNLPFSPLYQADSKSSLGCLAIWSLLSHSLQHTLAHISTQLGANTTTQFAWLPLYFIMCHVAVWDMVSDFIYVELWWLSYLCWSEIAVDQCRLYVSLKLMECLHAVESCSWIDSVLIRESSNTWRHFLL